jgi:hypothetical protein
MASNKCFDPFITVIWVELLTLYCIACGQGVCAPHCMTSINCARTLALISVRRTVPSGNIYIGKAVPQHTYGGTGGERRYSSHLFLTSALDGGEWSSSRPGRVYPRGMDPGYPLDRRLGGPKTCLDSEVREKIICLCRGSNPDRPVVQFEARHCTD